MKKKAAIGLIPALLALSAAGLAYGHSGETFEGRTYGMNMRGGMGHMMGSKYMDEMHDGMTKNMDPEYREQMDRMHNWCTIQLEETAQYKNTE